MAVAFSEVLGYATPDEVYFGTSFALQRAAW
jgi:hypothetical protein